MKTFDRKEIIKKIQAQIFKIDHRISLLQTERRKLKINIDTKWGIYQGQHGDHGSQKKHKNHSKDERIPIVIFITRKSGEGTEGDILKKILFV